MLKESRAGLLEYRKLSREEMESRGILGRLVGICADFVNPTRNGRKYSEELWENVFDNDVMKEKIQNRVCYGELGHPTDREEIDMSKAAICLAEVPQKGSDGKLRAVFDILNTPNGKILKSLCDYGSRLAISSRGQGDLVTDYNGDESVDPDTYICECFDVVIVPGVKEARLKYVTESLETKRYNKTLRQKLTEQLNTAEDKDREIMEESLNLMGIKLDEARILTKVSATSKQEEHKIVDSFVDEDGQRHFKLDNGSWITDKDVDCIERDEKLPAPEVEDQEAPMKQKDIRPETETVEDADLQEDGNTNITPEGWAELVLKSTQAGVDKNTLNKIYKAINPGGGDDEEAYGEDDQDLGDNQSYDDSGDGTPINEEGEELEESLHINELLKSENERKLYNILSYMSQDEIHDALVNVFKEIQGYDKNKFTKRFGKQAEPGYDGKETPISVIDNSHKNESISESCGDKKVVEGKVGNSKDLRELQEALLKVKQLEKDNLSLQEKLLVCNAKNTKLEENYKRYRASMVNLSESCKNLKKQNEKRTDLSEELKQKDILLTTNKQRFEKIVESRNSFKKKLEESLDKNDSLKSKIRKLEEELTRTNEELESVSNNSDKYLKAYKKLKESYIQAKADAYNLDADSVRRNLGESLKLSEIDRVCEKMAEENRNLSKLPFRLTEDTRIDFKKSTNESILGQNHDFFDDDNCDSLRRLLG